MTATDEANLIADARGGSIGAFERLYRMHSGRVFGLCLRLTANQADAQDATQETFIKAWRSLPRFRGDSAFSTWLHRIAFNESVSFKRKRQTERRHLQLVDNDEPIDGFSLATVEQIEKAVASLPDRAREAVVLQKIYGYTYEETAEFMNVSVGTCKAQVHRALKLLRNGRQSEEAPPDGTVERPATGTRDDGNA